ncbi:MAG: class I SAM-dependent methyltransferase [Bacilli bacterium]|nr:class I SAM-dependent methyltransferase [Bacilli bacterium]
MKNEYDNIKTENLFMNKQDYYNKYRPGYDKKIIELLEEKYGFNRNCVVAEYGAGTGKFADLMVPFVKKYYFIEPNIDMIDFAKDNNKSSNIIFLNEKAEETSIPDETINFAFAVHSFHYFEKEIFKKELNRVLTKNGYFCIIWYDYNSEETKIQDEWRDLITGVKGFKDNHNKKNDRINIYKNEFYEEYSFNIKKEFTYEELLGLGLSISSTPLPDQKKSMLILRIK